MSSNNPHTNIKKSKTALSALKYNVAFALVMATLLLGTDQLFSLYLPKYTFAFNERRFLGFSIFLFLVSFSQGKKFLLGFFVFVELMIYSEMVHLNVYKSLISPYTYHLLYVHWNEVRRAAGDFLSFAWGPSGFVVGLFGLSWLAVHFFHQRTYKIRFFPFLILFLFTFFPVRSYVIKDDFGIRTDVHASLFYNSYSSLSYFASHIVPSKIIAKPIDPDSFKVVVPEKQRLQPDANIILVIGESLGYKLMSLYGYEQDTTPFLSSLKSDPNFVYKKAVSCAVATNIALPLFMNMLCELDAIPKIVMERTCLFKLAKNNGFKTSFFSSQDGNNLKGILGYFCPGQIDLYKGAYEIHGDYFTPLKDKQLLKQLDQIDFNSSNFIVMQQQSSHAPYGENYTPEFKKFNKEGENSHEKLKNNFLNAVLYTDSFLKDLLSYLKKHSQKETYVLFTPDHGESLGEGGRWGHLQLFPEQFNIPFFVYKVGDAGGSNLLQKLRSADPVLTHKQISEIIAYLLGYNKGLYSPSDSTYVLGKDLEGFDGYLELKIQGEQVSYSEKKFPK